MDTIEQEIEQERQLDKMDDTSRETNPYKELIVNNAEKIEPLMTQMEQWSILSNVLNYFCVGLSFCCILDSGADSLIQNMF